MVYQVSQVLRDKQVISESQVLVVVNRCPVVKEKWVNLVYPAFQVLKVFLVKQVRLVFVEQWVKWVHVVYPVYLVYLALTDVLVYLV